MINRHLLALTTILLACTSLSRAQGFKLPASAPTPSTQPFVPEGEKQFNLSYATIIPGARITVRGILYVGDLYSDYIHPNHLGHEIMADVLEALLTDKDVRTWTHGPAADRARATTGPAR
jgi:hypothetical protein